jgi:putative tryptophan/tyrosine transport system substrate-binding protein
VFEFDKAFEATSRERARALMVLPDPMFVSQAERSVALSAKSRLPAMYAHREFVDAGGLMFYGASLADMWRRAATYVDKILKGTKPADLPVEQPMKFADSQLENRQANRRDDSTFCALSGGQGD